MPNFGKRMHCHVGLYSSGLVKLFFMTLKTFRHDFDLPIKESNIPTT